MKNAADAPIDKVSDEGGERDVHAETRHCAGLIDDAELELVLIRASLTANALDPQKVGRGKHAGGLTGTSGAA